MRVLVVGGASGLGRAIAELCLARGDTVSVLDIDAAGLATLPASVERALLDLADGESVAAVVTALREGAPFDLVAVTAGISASGRFETLDRDRLAHVVATNLTGPISLVAALLQAGLVARKGRLVLVSSLSHFVGYPGASVYAATKQGLVGFARSIRPAVRRELGASVLVMAPGPMDTGHAERYAPPGSKRGGRINPDVVAAAILRRWSGGVMVPGLQAKLAAAAGVLCPQLIGRIMRRLIYERF